MLDIIREILEDETVKATIGVVFLVTSLIITIVTVVEITNIIDVILKIISKIYGV